MLVRTLPCRWLESYTVTANSFYPALLAVSFVSLPCIPTSCGAFELTSLPFSPLQRLRPRPAPDVFNSFRRGAYLRPAILLDFLRDEFLAFGAINIARHFSRRVLLENDQPIVAVHKKGRFVQRLQLRRLIIASLLCH
jgi:hypothetical protein